MNDRTLPTKDTETGPSASTSGGSWAYPSLAASGMVEVELPSLPGSPHPTEQLHARDFGGHVVSKIEASLKGYPYPKSGPQQSPAVVLAHYIGTAKGLKLMRPEAISHLERLAKEFAAREKETDRKTYFSTTIRPYLLSLTPSRNGAASKTTGNLFPNSKMPPART